MLRNARSINTQQKMSPTFEKENCHILIMEMKIKQSETFFCDYELNNHRSSQNSRLNFKSAQQKSSTETIKNKDPKQ